MIGRNLPEALFIGILGRPRTAAHLVCARFQPIPEVVDRRGSRADVRGRISKGPPVEALCLVADVASNGQSNVRTRSTWSPVFRSSLPSMVTAKPSHCFQTWMGYRARVLTGRKSCSAQL